MKTPRFLRRFITQLTVATIMVQAPLSRAAYLDDAKTLIDKEVSAHYSHDQIDAATSGTTAIPDGVVEIAAAQARLWLLRGKTEKTYSDNSLYALKAIASQWSRAQNANVKLALGFQCKEAFVAAYDILTTNGVGNDDSAFLASSKGLAKASLGFSPAIKLGTDNSDGFNMAAIVHALKVWPDIDADGKLIQEVKNNWNTWAKHHDTNEASLNYNDLYLQMMIITAQRSADLPALQQENYLAQLKSADSRLMFNRFRDQVTGTGTVPIYGDNGSGGNIDAFNSWQNVFEWAGAQWSDGTFRWAAARKYGFGKYGSYAALTLYLLTYADEWANPAITAAAPAVSSALLTRSTDQGPSIPDQILLAPTRDQQAPFFDVNLFYGPHGHGAQTGAVALYQVGGTVYLRGLGYDCSTSSEASMFLVNDSSQPFPWRGMPQQDTWYEAKIPTAMLVTVDDPSDPNYGKTVIDRPEWRWETRDKNNNSDAWLSRFRLIAVDGSETLLNATDNATGWPQGTTVSDGPSTGTKALKFVAYPNATGNNATVYKVPVGQSIHQYFDPASFPYVRFWWKAHSAAAIDQQICIMREYYGASSGAAAPWDQVFAPITTASVKNESQGVRGTYTMKNYMGLGNTLERQMMQLRDGSMVIMDNYTAASDHDGDVAGPIWQLLASSAPTAINANTYDAAGFFDSTTRTITQNHLLVVMESTGGRSYGAVQPPAPLWGRQNPYAVYAKQTINRAQKASFVTVLLPHADATDAKTLAAGVTIVRNGPSQVTVTIKNGQTYTVQLTAGQ